MDLATGKATSARMISEILSSPRVVTLKKLMADPEAFKTTPLKDIELARAAAGELSMLADLSPLITNQEIVATESEQKKASDELRAQFPELKTLATEANPLLAKIHSDPMKFIRLCNEISVDTCAAMHVIAQHGFANSEYAAELFAPFHNNGQVRTVTEQTPLPEGKERDGFGHIKVVRGPSSGTLYLRPEIYDHLLNSAINADESLDTADEREGRASPGSHTRLKKLLVDWTPERTSEFRIGPITDWDFRARSYAIFGANGEVWAQVRPNDQSPKVKGFLGDPIPLDVARLQLAYLKAAKRLGIKNEEIAYCTSQNVMQPEEVDPAIRNLEARLRAAGISD